MKIRRYLRETSLNLPRHVHAAPALAGDLAFEHFCTPLLSDKRALDFSRLTRRSRFYLRHAHWRRVQTPHGSLQTYIFEPDREPPRGAVLLVHGWTSEASFMTAFVEPVRRAGFRVVGFDLPAHGYSDGRCTNLAACSRAMHWLADALGPIHGVVAHSMGGLVSLLVAEGGPPMPKPLSFGRMVLLACPNRLSDITRDFGAKLGLTHAAQRAYEKRIERVGHRSVAGFSAAALLQQVKRPVLLIHSRDDADVPFSDAEQIAQETPGVELMAFDGLGHRKLLYAPPVTRAAASYIVQP
jgi:pimeloyl-ACP methyl ester carboxylesterase